MAEKNHKEDGSLSDKIKRFIENTKNTVQSIKDWFDDWKELHARQREFSETEKVRMEETRKLMEKEKIILPGKPVTSSKKSKLSEKTKKLLIVDGILIVLLILAVIAGFKISEAKKDARETEGSASLSVPQKKEATGAEEKVQEAVEQPVNTVSLTISAAGDCTLGTDEAFSYSDSLNAKFEEVGDPGWFFANVKDIFSADDLTIVNFEGTLTASTERQDKQFAFKAEAQVAKILPQGFVEAVNLANNHTYDYGEQGYADTIAVLDAENITSFDGGRTAVMEVKGVKIGLLGVNELAVGLEGKNQAAMEIAALREQGAQLVIATFHWGNELDTVPDSIQTEMAHAAVDSGADLVLGHHPHVLQGIENYKGKNIVYSLGNFCFGGNSYPSDMDTMIFQQTFTFIDGALAEDNVTNLIPCSISSETGYNNYQPTPAQGEEKERIQQKIEERSAAVAAKNVP